MMPALNSTL